MYSELIQYTSAQWITHHSSLRKNRNFFGLHIVKQIIFAHRGYMIDKERITVLKSKSYNQKENYVIYWMQASQRVNFNHALAYAIELANEKDIPLLVYFQLLPDFPDATSRHYAFMIEGLVELHKDFMQRNIKMIISSDDYRKNSQLASLSDYAYAIITDRGYLRFQKNWRSIVSKQIKCPLIQIESDVVCPVETTSNKEEYAARTIRPKILKNLDHFLQDVTIPFVNNSSLHMEIQSLDLEKGDILNTGNVSNQDSGKTPYFVGGSKQAYSLLQKFIEDKIQFYHQKSNDPSVNFFSDLSPYLHFGMISPIEISLQILMLRESFAEKFLEQLIVRRELAINFVHYNPSYDTLQCLPEWAQKTLTEHEHDSRHFTYSLKDFETASTHDDCWNAAQSEMIKKGKMHGYMRMYWGKKIIEWTKNPATAYLILVYLNNKYELDGRDPNGYAGIAWCFGKHDQAWKERPIFGKVRYMNKKGLHRKFDMKRYIDMVNNL